MELHGFAYRLVRTNHGSARYGVCEVCGGHVDTTYHLTKYQAYTRHDKKKYPLSIEAINGVIKNVCRSLQYDTR